MTYKEIFEDLKSKDSELYLRNGLLQMVERNVAINTKTLVFGRQAHQLTAGIVRAMGGDRGGQLYAYQPAIPAVDA